ncbi:hypothetical protein C8Q74DRAFT_745792 [Fomes fomentarius]|nr:hypothetical protein C8Q74DRAFT_745792 [Fomes fomentarius]
MGTRSRDAVSGYFSFWRPAGSDGIHLMLMPDIAFCRDEIKDALPASPTDSAPGRPPFQDTQAAVPVYESAPGNAPSSHQAPDPSHSHPRLSPLTPPEYHGYHQDYVHAPQPSMSRPGLPQYPSSQGTLSFSYDGDVHQLWNMDGAPASPPPLPDFNMFMPPPQQPQHYAPPPQPAHSHKPPALSPMYTHPQPISTTHRSSVPTIPTPAHTHINSGFQSMRPPQPHPIRTSFPPTYHHPPQGHTPLPPEYRASSYKEEDEPLGDHECLRLRLLEEAYRQRAPQGGPLQGPGAGYPGPSHHSPDQWVNREQR